MTKKLDLKQQIEEARQRANASLDELHRLQARYEEEVSDPEMRANIGKCFKYRNCYSYAKIVGVRSGCYRVLEFNLDNRSETLVEERLTAAPMTDNYEPISGTEFRQAVLPMLAALKMEVEA